MFRIMLDVVIGQTYESRPDPYEIGDSRKTRHESVDWIKLQAIL